MSPSSKIFLDNPENIHFLPFKVRKHNTVGGNALRAAVMGGNDGLMCQF